MSKPLEFHWALPIEAPKKNEAQADQSGGVDLDALVELVRTADELPITSLLTPFGFHMPDPIPLLAMLAGKSKRVQFMLAYRSGLMSPTLFTQQVNTLSQLLGGRICLNMIAGFSPVEQAYYGDFLEHDARFERAEEFMQVCNLLWRDKSGVNFSGRHYQVKDADLKTHFVSRDANAAGPKIYLSGNSRVAQGTAAQLAHCWLRYGDTPEKIAAAIGTSKMATGLRMSVIARETREEALQDAYRVVESPNLKWREFIKGVVQSSDSVAVKSTYALAENASSDWLGPNLWAGAVPYRGGPSLAIVGSYSEVAEELLAFKKAGVGEFILSGWPTLNEMRSFCQNVLPRVRQAERERVYEVGSA